jgi:hypothetical protein
MVASDDQVAWFDWERSGTRCRLDDVVWLPCDEFTLDVPEIEARLIDHYLGEFADHLSLDEATFLKIVPSHQAAVLRTAVLLAMHYPGRVPRVIALNVDCGW